MPKWMVVVERVEHVSYIIDANAGFTAAQTVNDDILGILQPHHKTLDTERIISVIPIPQEDLEQ
jgi:hypothetical protein